MDESPDRLELDSRLTDLARVQPWIEAAAERHGVPDDARFAMHLCIEEALVNVVVHGYCEEPGHPIVLLCTASVGSLVFTIDDRAPSFDPLAQAPPNAPVRAADLVSMQPGGNGIRLLRRFAGSLSYERLADGNRLTIGFPVPSLK